MSFSLKLWGVRGSLPAPVAPDQFEKRIRSLLGGFQSYLNGGGTDVDTFLEGIDPYKYRGFGGHTACAEAKTDTAQIIIDGGSGIRRLGEQMMLGPCGIGQGEVHIVMTHFHWDHVIGLPFFVPIFIPGNKIHFYSVQEDLEEQIKKVFQKPSFPVPFEALGATIEFHKLRPRDENVFGDIILTPYQLDHPDPCWGMKLSSQGKTVSYCVDTECKRMSENELGADIDLYRGLDALVFDAQYTFLEAAEKIDWGHASAPLGLDIAFREKIPKVYFIHHDPAASDEKIMQAVKQTEEYYNLMVAQKAKRGDSPQEIQWYFAPEGTLIEL